MSIVVADNFQYKGGKPLDARMKFASVSDMVGTLAADLYDGCFAYVTGTKKYYSYDSSNETDPSLGKWKEYSAGAEYSDFTGATFQEAGAHGLVPAPTTGDISKFLKGDGTWATVPMPSFDYSNTSPEAMNFSTDEKVIGTWTDGKPLYQKTVNFGELPNNTNKGVAHNISNLENVVECNTVAHNSRDAEWYTVPIVYNSLYGEYNVALYINSTTVNINTTKDRTMFTAYVTLRYTKTTDTAVASGEKIVGQWIDGKPVYEKVFTGLNAIIPEGTSSWNDNVLSISSLNVDKIISITCLRNLTTNNEIYIPNEVTCDNGYIHIKGNGTSREINEIILRYVKSS